MSICVYVYTHEHRLEVRIADSAYIESRIGENHYDAGVFGPSACGTDEDEDGRRKWKRKSIMME